MLTRATVWYIHILKISKFDLLLYTCRSYIFVSPFALPFLVRFIGRCNVRHTCPTHKKTITENIEYYYYYYYWRLLGLSVLAVAVAAAAAATACIVHSPRTRDIRERLSVLRGSSNETTSGTQDTRHNVYPTTCSAACILNAEKCVRVIYLCLALNAKLAQCVQAAVCSVR